jgi:predicted glycosyltransferase involved in capsule biosynthesis
MGKETEEKKMILSVITSYYNRPKSYKKFNDFALKASEYNKNIQFIIDEWKENKMFSTAICHNRAVHSSEGKWILKIDIDCNCELQMFDKIFDLIKDKDYTFFANFGCKNYNFAGDLGFPCGNQYLCSKQAYLEIGGESEWYGYGWEDYAFLYKLAKLQDPNFKLDYTQSDITNVIRDQLARKLNEKYKDIYFYHELHERIRTPEQTKQNRINLYNLCKELDND